jgi:hypothetical protein
MDRVYEKKAAAICSRLEKIVTGKNRFSVILPGH